MVLSQGVAFALLVLVAAVASVSAWTSIGAYPTADELSSLSVSPSGVVLITGYDNTLLHVPNATALRSGVTHAWSFIEAGTRSPDWVEGAYFYASTYSPAANAFFVSADGGRIVRCDIAGTSVESCTVVFGLFDSWMGDNLRAITASTGSTLIACGAAQIYVSTNMGVGWIPTPVTSSSYQFNVITYSSTLTVNGVTGFFIGAGGSSYNSPESASNAAVAISHDGTIWTAIAESNNFPEWKCEDSFTTLTVSDKFIIASGCQQFYPEVYLAAPISNLSDWAPISIPSAAESSNFTFNVFAWAEEQGVFVANGYSTKSPRQNYVAYCDDASLDNWTVVSLDTELDNLAMFQYVPVLGGMLGVGTLGNVWTSNWPPEKWHRSNTNPFYVSGPNTFYLYELTDVAIGSTSTANSIIIVTGYGPVSISSDNGQSWHSSSPNQDGASFTVLYEPENNALVAIQQQGSAPNTFQLYTANYVANASLEWKTLHFGHNVTRQDFMFAMTYSVAYGNDQWMVIVGNATQNHDPSAFLMVSNDAISWERVELVGMKPVVPKKLLFAHDHFFGGSYTYQEERNGYSLFVNNGSAWQELASVQVSQSDLSWPSATLVATSDSVLYLTGGYGGIFNYVAVNSSSVDSTLTWRHLNISSECYSALASASFSPTTNQLAIVGQDGCIAISAPSAFLDGSSYRRLKVDYYGGLTDVAFNELTNEWVVVSGGSVVAAISAT
eukprot:m.162848 g.162848  ORF g.162848 m.162848 type:complete len:724 (+) comp53065_c0_seq1:29-2200(+)